MRSVSMAQRLVSIRSRRIVASTMIPVSPIPPTVAQNSSGRSSGETSTIEPSASSRRSRSTLVPNEPSRWWFLPWMSLATAPPTVTKRVPGDTGTKKPRGTITRSSSSRLTPAGTVAVAAASSMTESWA